MGGGEARAQVTASASTKDGWLFVGGALTPYDVENLCDQILTLGRRNRGDIHVEVELGGTPADSPELRTLEHRVRRLKKRGVAVQLHATRGRKRALIPPQS